MRTRVPAFLAMAVVMLTACGGNGVGAASPTPSLASRPSSPAMLQIVSPTPNQVVTGSTVRVVVALQNAMVVKQYSTHIQPDQGHVHLFLDKRLIYMAYQLTQDVPVTPGTYALQAEFVASDHVSFNPKVWSSVVIFTVR